jgi:glutaredoxin
MEPLTIALLILGVLIAVIGAVMLIIAAFRENVWWGLAYLFVPMASLVFVCMHWSRAKTGFLVNLIGALVAVGGLAASPTVRAAITSGLNFPKEMRELLGEKAPAKELTAQIQEKREQIEQLEKQFAQLGATQAKRYQEMNARRAALKAEDAAAVAQFNAEATAYQAQNDALKQLRVDSDAAQQALTGLLAERARLAPPAASGKQVVMFTTSHCPACKAAKAYFARKGVRYEERDVETSSSAREEFDRLGGRGVPLILVGKEKMEGFSEQRLNQLL